MNDTTVRETVRMPAAPDLIRVWDRVDRGEPLGPIEIELALGAARHALGYLIARGWTGAVDETLASIRELEAQERRWRR